VTENGWLGLLLAATLGALLAGVHLAILWLALRGVARAGQVGASFLASLLLRLAVVVAGFLGMALYGGWRAVAAGLIGFVAVRTLALGRIRGQIGEVHGGRGEAG
jgi:F1F0 ATPase subunit 2